ncbi:hypothetical protein AYJ54_42365 [Bradyrhizobium centrolobii]|uniref:Uncharacterized protein n=1 Tax=Bradyrhizobium centrolobii TaxID=1505087 RepID=A0A176Z445_9BRAD|nr:hypothetical protein [Bradyrhizobium centrolobii]OAF14213.1 hypothetical protein AYJ54_42365 [Bradyrhizobium centrolobii]
MLRIPVCLLFLGLGAISAAADDNGLALLDFFEKTCARRPALPTTLQRLAKAAGFESEHGDLTPDMESGDELDLIYFAKLVRGAATFKLDAYFSGSRGAPSVSCTMTTSGVNGQDLAPAIEAAEEVTSPGTEFSKDGVIGKLNWTFGAAGGNDRLEMTFRRDEPRRTYLNLTYQIRKP